MLPRYSIAMDDSSFVKSVPRRWISFFSRVFKPILVRARVRKSKTARAIASEEDLNNEKSPLICEASEGREGGTSPSLTKDASSGISTPAQTAGWKTEQKVMKSSTRLQSCCGS